MELSLLQAVLFLVLALSGGDSRPGNFKIIGPGGGGAMFHPTISPHDPNTVLISCDMTGSYISHDGGDTWRMFSLRGVVRFFVFDPQRPKVMYAQADGLWRSTDNGDTWNLVYPKASTSKEIKMNSDHADEDLVAEPNPLGSISAMAIDPEDSKSLVCRWRRQEERRGRPFLFRVMRAQVGQRSTTFRNLLKSCG